MNHKLQDIRIGYTVMKGAIDERTRERKVLFFKEQRSGEMHTEEEVYAQREISEMEYRTLRDSGVRHVE